MEKCHKLAYKTGDLVWYGLFDSFSNPPKIGIITAIDHGVWSPFTVRDLNPEVSSASSWNSLYGKATSGEVVNYLDSKFYKDWTVDQKVKYFSGRFDK